jgi:hypothetical protein
MFKLAVPTRIIHRHAESKIVLDPFCGRGTSLYAARLLGKESIGIDLNPVAAAVSKAKVATIKKPRIESALRKGLRTLPKNIPEGEFWQRCFHPETLREICSLREFLSTATGDSADVLRAVVLGILHGPKTRIGSYLSNQMPRTYATKPDSAIRFWRKHRLRPTRIDTSALVQRRLAYLLEDVPATPGGEVICGDALTCLKRLSTKSDLVITSPPYMGLRTYLPDQWLRLWFLGGLPRVIYEWPGQIGVENEEKFTAALATMLRGIDGATKKRANAYVILGSIPSVPVDISSVMSAAIKDSKSNWRLLSKRSSGRADAGKRQAAQFANGSKPTEEFLFHLNKS